MIGKNMIIDFHTHALSPEHQEQFTTSKFHGRVLAASSHGRRPPHTIENVLEAQKIGAKYGDKLKLLVPGIRPAGARTDDQKRTVTAAEAARAGANYIVLGRMITEAKEPASELRSVMKTI